MTPNEYQQKAHSFATYGENPEYAYAGLAEECGEVLGKRAKFIRKHQGVTPEVARKWETMRDDRGLYWLDIKRELGDVLWMVAEIATTMELTLEEIMEYNIDKLTDRKKRGVIVGEGDTTEERLANARRKENV